MGKTYKLMRTCPTCGAKVSDQNKSGFCNRHRDRTGANNSFFGKKHRQETLDKAKEKCREASLKLWQNEEYVERVKAGLKSEKNLKAHSSEEFRKKQSDNAIKQMQNEEQRKLRSQSMKLNWETGKIIWQKNARPNFSKDELRFGELLKSFLGENSKYLEQDFKIERYDLPNHYFCPDFRYKNFILEFDGDFWHAKDRLDEEIVHHNVSAKEIRQHDELKNETYEKAGFTVLRIWQSEFLADEEKCVRSIADILLK